MSGDLLLGLLIGFPAGLVVGVGGCLIWWIRTITDYNNRWERHL
jgi:hypothetical protein